MTILGSTGSIGKSALDVVGNSDDFAVYGLSAHSNISLLEEQLIKFKPSVAAVSDPEAAEEFEKTCEQKGYDVELLKGTGAAAELAGRNNADIVLIGVVGNDGIAPALAAIDAGKTIALANKEALVSAGELIMKRASQKNTEILPVDSEHSAVFQCLRGYPSAQLNRIILTASGGAFRGMAASEIRGMKAASALKHPTWRMGAKITIDSATLMNKGLEVIEAHWLFDVPTFKIDVLLHPQSIVHSLVEFRDGSVLAQLGTPDMRFPIHYALHYPERPENPFPKLDLTKTGALTFDEPDFESFPCLKLAYWAIEKGGTTPCVLNEANQELVGLYLEDKIGFYDISNILADAVNAHKPAFGYSCADLDAARKWASEFVEDAVKTIGR